MTKRNNKRDTASAADTRQVTKQNNKRGTASAAETRQVTKRNNKRDTASAADTRQVTDSFVVEFRKYTTELSQKFLERKPWVPKDESKILSFIPGTVTKIYVKEGDHVEEGTPLMILEAMKMKNTVYVERPGKILKINVTEGERVPKSKVIFEFDLDNQAL